MKNKIKMFILGCYLSLSQIVTAYADFDFSIGKTKNLMASRMLAGVLTFLQYSAFILFAIGLGMFLYSFHSEDGAKKSDSLKIFGVGIILFGLKAVAQLGGLI